MSWLVRGDDVLAAAEVAETRRARLRGVRGRDDLEGALVLRPCRQVHTVGVRFPIDVAFCDAEGRVLCCTTLRPWRISRWVAGARFVVEARAGAFERWRLAVGDVLEIE